ncbi:50S ribosomal protein L11 methyltransferase [Caldovatus aquaticus]|uniref:Ribosomal protein L11 methyltransferase n=1 Tax=Caldovatus aquaticus TaxID=2865671 RepID=A0ABS7EX00_9PROT|nr:50S ribosomal protein L11 methyltransferase [Caldovatus aquaticus]MBW8267886.1 50S ribosomal protein L11 methyltransferase [Caldovatus aquaticus]
MRADGPSPTPLSRRRAEPLELLSIEGLPESAVPAFEAALQTVCATVAYIRDEASDTWRVEGVREAGAGEETLQPALALAAAAAGIAPPPLSAEPIAAEGWLERSAESFPEQPIGARFLIRPTHLPDRRTPGRIVLRLDAGLAFGSGEHASTRGCLIAFERLANSRRPRRVLDLGAGSGILAIAAAKRLRRPVLATDIEPWSVRVAADNARRNGVAGLVRVALADGWRHRAVRAGAPYDLVFANILARPLCAMARDLARHLAPGGAAILAGLLGAQARWVLAAHRRQGLRLAMRLDIGPWTTLVLRKGNGG